MLLFFLYICCLEFIATLHPHHFLLDSLPLHNVFSTDDLCRAQTSGRASQAPRRMCGSAKWKPDGRNRCVITKAYFSSAAALKGRWNKESKTLLPCLVLPFLLHRHKAMQRTCLPLVLVHVGSGDEARLPETTMKSRLNGRSTQPGSYY